ncbi:MAG: beta-lactamase family protein [Nannocystis sp.]|nr:beta-lactamase family protein [Nannocystis sp.]
MAHLFPYSVFNSTSKGDPGSFEYSNWGIMLAGRLAEVVELVAQRVFQPAQMCTATYDPADVLTADNYIVGNGPALGCPEPELGHDGEAPYEMDELACRARDPNGGVRASAVDIGRFAATFLADLDGAHTMLSQDLAHRMLCPGGGTYKQGCAGRVEAPPFFPYYDSYGYTNLRHTTKGLTIYSHGGNRPGFTSLLWIVPERQFAVVILGNQTNINNQQSAWAEKIVDCWLNDARRPARHSSVDPRQRRSACRRA